MSFLADWCNLLKQATELYPECPPWRLIWPLFAGVFAMLYAILLVTDGYLFPCFLAIGFILGAGLFGHDSPNEQLFATSMRYTGHAKQLEGTDVRDAATIKVTTDTDASVCSDMTLKLFYPPLTTIVDRLIECFYRDFVLNWWAPLNVHDTPEFGRSVRSRLNGAVHSIEKILMKQERNDLVMATLYGVANVLIIHMRECRNLENSGLSLEGYIAQNPQSPFAQLISIEEQHQQLRSLSTTILRRVLPSSDTDSIVLLTLLRELLATYFFGAIVDTCSDPDFINCYIIDYLSSERESPGDARSANAEEGDNEVDGIRSVVERAAESLMAESGFETDPAKTTATDSENATNEQMQQAAPFKKQTIQTAEPVIPEREVVDSSTTVKMNNALPNKSQSYEQLSATSITEDSLPPSPASLPPVPGRPAQLNNTTTSNKKKLSAPRADEAWTQAPMIYAPGTVNFSVMDISGPGGHSATTMPDKSKLMFIVQIERPAMEDQAGSEGGGYVITRTYTDFEVFHAIISARHAKRVARMNLRLPLDPIRSWLKLGSHGTSQPPAQDTDSICSALERYLHMVAQDSELGRDQIILAFLRKERRAAISSEEPVTEVSFADEYMDEVSAYAALSERTNGRTATMTPTLAATAQSSVGKAMSMLARAPSLAVKSVARIDADPTSFFPSDFLTSPTQEPRRWFTRRSSGREGSISSVRSSNSSLSGKEENSEDDVCKKASETQPTCSSDTEDEAVASKSESSVGTGNAKPLSPLDIELLIETTFALVVEIFDLTTANNRAWMRRTLLNVLREIVRRSYTEIIAEHYSSYIQDYMSPDALVGWCNKIMEKFWPEGQLAKAREEDRTEEEKEASRQQARTLLMSTAVPSGVRQLIGDQNTSAAMDRLWARCQNQSLNRVLILQLLERLMRPIFG